MPSRSFASTFRRLRARGLALCLISGATLSGCQGDPKLDPALDPCAPSAATSALDASLLHYDYGDVLGKGILFYEAQRSGNQQSARVPFRKPATLNDGADVGMDLSGGWYDAGDHVKFGLPMAYSATMLAFSLYESPGAYAESGERDAMLENLRFVNDYFLNAYDPGKGDGTEDDRLAIQVGDGHADHGFWGPPEAIPEGMARPTTLATANQPATEVAAGTAAAMASASLVFRGEDDTYADRLLNAAKQLYTFADAHRGNDIYKQVAQDFYNSFSGFEDELGWGAAWLYAASGDETYREKANAQLQKTGVLSGWAHSWDDVSAGTALLMQKLAPTAERETALRAHFATFLPGGSVTYTEGGLAWLAPWGSLRYTSTEAFLAMVFARQVSEQAYADELREFGIRQLNYILGDNPRSSSYVVGVGNNPPQNPHHRAAHDSPDFSIGNPVINTHVLVGAMVGGPETADDFGWQDDRNNYTTSEVSTDYNAGFVGALAEAVRLAEPTANENRGPGGAPGTPDTGDEEGPGQDPSADEMRCR